MIKDSNLNVSAIKMNAVPKQKPDRFLSAGDHIHVTSVFEHTLANPRHTVIGSSWKPKELYQFLMVNTHSNCNI